MKRHMDLPGPICPQKHFIRKVASKKLNKTKQAHDCGLKQSWALGSRTAKQFKEVAKGKQYSKFTNGYHVVRKSVSLNQTKAGFTALLKLHLWTKQTCLICRHIFPESLMPDGQCAILLTSSHLFRTFLQF